MTSAGFVRAFWTAGAVGLATVSSGPAVGAVTLSADPTGRHQTMDGFGTTLAWWKDNPGAAQRSFYNDPRFYDLYFDDLGASAIRLDLQKTVLSTSRSLTPSQAEMSTPINLVADTDTNIAKFNFDAFGLGNVGRVVEAAQTRALDGFKVHGAIWSPPHWMKGPGLNWSTGQVVDSGPVWTAAYDSAGGSLIDTPANLEQFGRYVAAYAKGFERRFGTPMYSISLQNEATFSLPYNSAVYTPALYRDALKAVRAAFDAHNAAHPDDPILTRLVGPDDVGMGLVSSADMGARAMAFVNAVNADPAARDAMDGWVMHGFAGTASKTGGSSAWTTWPTFYDGRHPQDGFAAPYWQGAGRDKPLWVSEDSGDQPTWLTPSESGRRGALGLGLRMIAAFTAGDASAYLYWQTMDSETNAPSQYTLTNGFDPDQPKFAAFAHWSRYVRPGAVRIDLADNDELIYGAAFEHADDGTYTFVLANLAYDSRDIVLDLAGLEAVLGVRAAVASTDGDYLAAFTPTLSSGNTRLSFTMAAESMATIQLGFAGAQAGDYNGSGGVEQGDLDLVLLNWGRAGTPPGWVNHVPVGLVDQSELDGVLLHWGASSEPAFAHIPEPVAAPLSVLGAAAAVSRRRKGSGGVH